MWARRYIGMPYDEADCAALLNLVNRREFNRDLGLPEERSSSALQRARAILDGKAQFEETSSPEDGDAVLMRGRARMWHVGTFVKVGTEDYVLHAMKATGGACIHKIRELKTFGLHFEGFYKWRG